ncbi:MAG: glycosyltransferase [Chitinophagales bacterium]|nr:glycosyltransferase [Chitinophagales bacterium]
MKRIICCLTNDLSFDQRMIRICNSLTSFGYEVVLCGRELPASIPLVNRAFRQHRIRCIFNKGKLFYIEFNLRLFCFLLKEKVDAINAIDLDTAAASLMAAKLKGTKLVYDAHELFTEVPEVINRPLTKKIWEILESFFIPKTNLTYTVSESIASIFTKKYDKSVFTIRNVPLLQEFTPAQKERAIIYQGALNQGRGLEFLLLAMQNIDAQLWLAGDGDIAPALKRQVRELHLENKVHFLGKLTPEALLQKTKQALAGFNVLEAQGLSYYYSLSNKTFDYIHAEIPQVISAFPEMKLLNQSFQFALEIEEISAEEISKAFNRLLLNEALYNTLTNNCAKAKQVLNWQNESLQLKQYYEQLFR